jgi:hypothetical protein
MLQLLTGSDCFVGTCLGLLGLGGIIVPIMLPHLFTGDPFDIPVMRPEGWVGGGY